MKGRRIYSETGTSGAEALFVFMETSKCNEYLWIPLLSEIIVTYINPPEGGFIIKTDWVCNQ